MRFKAIFVNKDGLEDTPIGGSYGLKAETIGDAEAEAMKLQPPEGANFFKILDEERVVLEHGFAL